MQPNLVGALDAGQDGFQGIRDILQLAGVSLDLVHVAGAEPGLNFGDGSRGFGATIYDLLKALATIQENGIEFNLPY